MRYARHVLHSVKSKAITFQESMQEIEASINRLIRLAYPVAPEDFHMRFAIQTFIGGIGDCELQQVL